MAQDSNNYWEQLERMEKLIRAAEVKAGVVFSFHSLILGLFVDRMDYFQGIFEKSIAFFIISESNFFTCVTTARQSSGGVASELISLSPSIAI